MGIPRFYGEWLRKQGFYGVLNRGLPGNVSSLSIDMNGMIHAAAQKTYAYGEHANKELAMRLALVNPIELKAEFHKTLVTDLENVVRSINPQDCLILAIDGVAPMAKIQQQRQRRYRSAMERSPNQIFDNNSVTPGTEFMRDLDDYIQRWLLGNRRELPPKLIYSSHLVPGEGEHKIMDLYRSGEVWGDAAENGGCHVLYGLDADLIMLSLISPLEHIVLSREDISDVVSIDNLKTALIQLMGTETAIDDFVVMLFLLGNDFLPHPPAFDDMSASIDAMINAYKRANQPLTTYEDDIPSIHWPGFAAFAKELARSEPELLANLSTLDPKYPASLLRAAVKGDTFYYSYYRTLWYNNAIKPRNGDLAQEVITLIRDYEAPGEEPLTEISPLTEQSASRMIDSYLTGIAWVYLYYQRGTSAVNVGWWYNYHHSPLMGDIASVAESFSSQLDNVEAGDDMILFSPVHQLLSVLPRKSVSLVPDEFSHLMNDGSIIRDTYPDSFYIEREGKDADWQGVAILPFAEPFRILDAVDSIVLRPERAKLWEPVATFVLMYSDEDLELINLNRSIQQKIQRAQRGRGRGGYDRGRGRGGYDRGRGRGDYDRGRGRGGYDRNRGRDGHDRNRGGYDRNRGGYERGSGGYDRNRGGYERERGRGRGDGQFYNETRQGPGGRKEFPERRGEANIIVVDPIRRQAARTVPFGPGEPTVATTSGTPSVVMTASGQSPYSIPLEVPHAAELGPEIAQTGPAILRPGIPSLQPPPSSLLAPSGRGLPPPPLFTERTWAPTVPNDTSRGRGQYPQSSRPEQSYGPRSRGLPQSLPGRGRGLPPPVSSRGRQQYPRRGGQSAGRTEDWRNLSFLS